MKPGFTAGLLGVGLLLTACAQQPIYTLPYSSAPPVALASPLPVSLTVTYIHDGKRDTKREQELAAQLHDLLAAGQSFREVPGAAGVLTVAVEDKSTSKPFSLLGTLSLALGRVFLSQTEFTPEGRRTVRALDVGISYAPAGGTGQSQVYSSALVIVTNNTQEPTDLVPMPDRKHAELALIGNDLNLFAANMTKPQGTTAP